jgi:polyhydroxybutyrate depolymerase
MPKPTIQSHRKFDATFSSVLAACFLLALLSVGAFGQDAPIHESPAKDVKEKIQVEETSREYVVHLPRAYSQEQHYPVVILFPGRNQEPDDMARLTRFNQLADKAGVIAVYPSSAHGQWNIGVRPEVSSQPFQQRRRGYGRGGWPGGGGYPGGGRGNYPNGGQNPNGQYPGENRNRPEPADDLAFLNQMLDQMALKYSVDSRRIYATGLEDGGLMALRAGCALADRIAAVASVGAEMPKTMICLPSRAVPLLLLEGTDDPIMPYKGGEYKSGRFHVLSAEDSAKTWAKFDRCEEKPTKDKIPPAQKSGKATETFTYNGCQSHAQVMLYSVKRGGNSWPGGEQYMAEKEIGKVSDALDANQTIWTFFSSRALPANDPGK